jgi:transposase
MFVRKKKNKSGLISIQIISKSTGKYKLIKTVGSSADEEEISRLYHQALDEIPVLLGQPQLNFDHRKQQDFEDALYKSIGHIELAGPELLLGRIFDKIGFNTIDDELFRHLVLARICYPGSKLKTVDYLHRSQCLSYDLNKVYRYLDKLYNSQKELVAEISYQHTRSILKDEIKVVFYDVTTLYFEIEQEDELRKTGFSKDGKAQHPQIVLGLLVSEYGYPLAYEIFEGNRYEGHTLIPVLEAFKKRFSLEHIVVVADAGLLSKDNITSLQDKQYEYIIGARLKTVSASVKKAILALKLKSGESTQLGQEDSSKLIISYSENRAKKDAFNRSRALEKLTKALTSGKLTKSNINNRGYNKYLKMEGDVQVAIDYEKFKADGCWDGLKGYLTNTLLTKDEVIEKYKHLWMIEKAFRISKTDLKIRPIYHRLKRRIEAHICIAFCAYKVYKELERQLIVKKAPYSVEKAIELINSIYEITFTSPYTKTEKKMLLAKTPEQQNLLKLFEI